MLKAFLSFEDFILPKVSKIIYWLGLVLIGLAVLSALFGAITMNNFLGVLVVLIGGAVAAVVWRIAVELWLVLFSIYEVLKDIRDRR